MTAIGDRDACATCGADIEWHGRAEGWVGRGRDHYCDTSGMARRDSDGLPIPLPHRKHLPLPRLEVAVLPEVTYEYAWVALTSEEPRVRLVQADTAAPGELWWLAYNIASMFPESTAWGSYRLLVQPIRG